MKLCSLDARSEVRSGYSSLFGLLDSVLAGRAQSEAARPPELVTCASWGRVKAGGTRHGLHRLWVEPR